MQQVGGQLGEGGGDAQAKSADRAEFGRRVTELRKARGLTQKVLADQVQLTAEHLSRIERGRMPPPRRPVVGRLAVALGLLDNPASWADFFAVAGYTPLSIQKSVSSGTLDAVRYFLEHSSASSRSLPDHAEMYSPTAIIGEASAVVLPQVIHGADAVLQSAIVLLRAGTPRHRAGDDSGIFVSWASASQLVTSSPTHAKQWQEALQAVLRSGTMLWHLWDIDAESLWSRQRAVEVSDLLNHPEYYRPYYLDRDKPRVSWWSLSNLLLVPRVGALIFLRTRGETIDTALYIDNPDSLGHLVAHARLLIEDAARPLLSTSTLGTDSRSSREERLSLAAMNADSIERPGERMLVKNGLSTLLLPPVSWLHRVRNDGLAGATEGTRGRWEELQQLYSLRKRESDAFEVQVQRWRHRDMYSRGAIRRFVEQGIVTQDDYVMMDLPRPTAEERAEALLQLLQRLRRYPNYEVALLDHGWEHLARLTWVIKVGYDVSISMMRPTSGGKRHLRIIQLTEPRIVGAFAAYFDQLWHMLPKHNRDRELVCRWLERQLDELEKQGAR